VDKVKLESDAGRKSTVFHFIFIISTLGTGKIANFVFSDVSPKFEISRTKICPLHEQDPNCEKSVLENQKIEMKK